MTNKIMDTTAAMETTATVDRLNKALIDRLHQALWAVPIGGFEHFTLLALERIHYAYLCLSWATMKAMYESDTHDDSLVNMIDWVMKFTDDCIDTMVSELAGDYRTMFNDIPWYKRFTANCVASKLFTLKEKIEQVEQIQQVELAWKEYEDAVYWYKRLLEKIA